MAEIFNGDYSVYVHTNLINGKKYVGITMRNPEIRWNKGNGYRYNSHFWNAIQKYGWDGFDHEIVASKLTKQEAENFEQLLIFKLKTYLRDYGYNNDMGGTATGKTSCETAKKISIALQGHSNSQKQKEIAKAQCQERWQNEEWRNHFSQKMLQKWADFEFREKMKKARSNVAYDSRNVPVLCEGKIFKNVKEFAQYYGLNRYTVNNWLCGFSTMPVEWYNRGLRNYEESRNSKIRIRQSKEGD